MSQALPALLVKTSSTHLTLPRAPQQPDLLRSGVERGHVSAIFLRGLRALARLPRRVVLGLIAFYQVAISPSLPALFGPTCGCRYYPTCSHYAAEAVRVHGAVLGSFLALRRLARCTPFHRGGTDFVPAPGIARRVCQRVSRVSA